MKIRRPPVADNISEILSQSNRRQRDFKYDFIQVDVHLLTYAAGSHLSVHRVFIPDVLTAKYLTHPAAKYAGIQVQYIIKNNMNNNKE